MSKQPTDYRRIGYAILSFTIGVWAFVKVNSISGPAFEPILAACGNSDIANENFAKETGYHSYVPELGLGAFKILVCLITQFLLELRETYPAGLLVWGGVIVVALPLNLIITVTAGRKGASGPVIYPTVIGLLCQVLGISVIIPMIYNPSYYFSGSRLGVAVTNFRILVGVLLSLPASMLTYFVFTAPTDGMIWEVSAGILGGPILAMMGLPLWLDKSSTLEDTRENITRSNDLIQKSYNILALVSFIFYSCLMAVVYQTYGFAFHEVWRDIWTEAGPSVAFMTIDTGVLFVGVLLFIAYHCEWKAMRALLMTPLLGPGAACCVVLKELENEWSSAVMLTEGKKIA